MKTQAAALWAATLLGFAAARPMAGSSCSSQTRAGSATIATYDHIPSNAGFHRGDTAKLMPGVYWDDDLDDVENLAPKSDCKLFYAEHNNPKEEGSIAMANYKMKYPTVALERSKHVKSVKCVKPDHMDITFKDRKSYNWAKRNWIPFDAAHNDTMVFVGKFDGCNPTKQDGMRSWSLVDDVTFNDDTMDVDATIIYKDIQEVAESATIQFGRYVPHDRKDDTAASPVPTGRVTSAQQGATPATATPHATVADYGRWGPNFDNDKDAKIGYTNALPAAPSITPPPTSPNPLHHKRFFGGLWNKVTEGFKDVTSAVKDIASDVSSVFVEATSAIESVASAIVTEAADIINDFTSYTGSMDIEGKIEASANTGPIARFNNLPGRPIIEDVAGLSLYCIDCGAQGTAKFSASITFSLLRGIDAGAIDFTGYMKASMSFGLYNTNTAVAAPIPIANYEVFNQGIPKLSIPNVITIGPYVALDLDATLQLGFTGGVRVGFELEFEKPQFHIDLKDLEKSTASGWEPKFTPIFDFNGNVSVSATFRAPLSLNFGINILKGKFEKAVAIMEAPTVKIGMINGASLSLDGKTDQWEGELKPETASCKGSVLALRVGLDTLVGVQGTPLWYPLLKLDIYKNEWCVEHDLFQKRSDGAAIDPPNNGGFTGRVYSETKELALVSGNNNNIYIDAAAQPGGGNGDESSYEWLFWNDLLVGSGDGRLIYAYPSEISKFGVSRFRLAPFDQVPKDWEQVVLVPNNNAMTAYTVGNKGQTLYPIVCTYKSQPTKVFLATSILEGSKALMSAELQDTITGGQVHTCGLMKLQAGERTPKVLN